MGMSIIGGSYLGGSYLGGFALLTTAVASPVLRTASYGIAAPVTTAVAAPVLRTASYGVSAGYVGGYASGYSGLGSVIGGLHLKIKMLVWTLSQTFYAFFSEIVQLILWFS